MMTFWKKHRRSIIEWSLWIAIPVILYSTGWYTEVLGRMQQVLLYTGVFQAHAIEQPGHRPDADMNLPLLAMNGDRVNLSDYRGRVVFINFWASWCPPCVAELPGIERLAGQVNGPGVAFLLINLDQDPQKARAFITRKELTLPVFRPDGPIPSLFRSQVIPATFIIDATGRLVLRHEGMAEYDTRAMRSLLTRLARSDSARSLPH